jgi:hypothetical protein
MAEPEQKYEQQQPPTLKPAPKEPFDLQIENLDLVVPEDSNIAYGWRPWAAEDRGFHSPEFVAITYEKKRVQGIRAEHRYDACLVQQVETIPDFALTFTMNFLVSPTHQTDEEWPEGIVVGVGVDPTGATDPRGDTVQWALRDLRYSQEAQASVTAICQDEVATVFVRYIAFIPGSDTISTNGTGHACSQTCYREAYPRTYLLLYPQASWEVWERAAKYARQHNYTLGGSADDAGLGSDILTSSTVIAIEPEKWDPVLTKEWFEKYYPPGVKFQTMKETNLPM